MTMPILPGLGGDKSAAPAATALADVFDQLDDDQISELVATAEAAGFGGDAEGTPGEEATESPEEADADGDVPSADEEPAEDDVEGVAAQGFEEITAWATQASESNAGMLSQVESALETAQGGEEAGAEPDAIEPLLEQAQALSDQSAELLSECEAAAKADDAHACAVAALKIERNSRILQHVVAQAQAYAETTETSEAGFQDEPAVKLWAERTAQASGPIGGIK